MKKILVSAILLALSIAAFGQKDILAPQNPITMGQGGAYVANAAGYNAFFYNPAGFARKSEFTLLSMNVYGTVDKNLLSLLAKAYNQNAGSLGSKSIESKDAGSDLTSELPTTQISALQTAATPITNYLTLAGPAAVTTALQNLATEPQYASLLSGVDLKNPGSNPSQLAAIIGPILESDPSKLSGLVTDLVNQVATVSGQGVPTGLSSAIAATVSAAQDLIKALNNEFPGDSTGGALLGIGYVGNGLGIGFFAGVQSGIYHVSADAAPIGRIDNTYTLAAGAGFNIWDGFSVGFLLRPTILGYSNFDPLAVMASVQGGNFGNVMPTILQNGIYKGFSLGVDVGGLLDIGPFTLGLAVKNLVPLQIAYTRYVGDASFTQYTGDLADFANSQYLSSSYQVPWGQVNFGVRFHPDLGALTKLVDFSAEADLDDVIGWIRQYTSNNDAQNSLGAWNALNLVNIGAEIDLLNFIALRGGFTQGAWTGGFGIKLFIMEINTAFSAKYAANPKSIADFSDVGFSLEIALLRL